MQLKFHVIDADSHAQVHKDAFTSRMSQTRFGERIPHLIETEDGHQRWLVNGKRVSDSGVSNCPAVMDDHFRTRQPQRWEEVPAPVYDPLARLAVMDGDGVDVEVLFPNPPVQGAAFLQGDAQFELACVRAYNDAMIQWRRASERYVPLGLIPYLGGADAAAAEVERIAEQGMRGIDVVAEPGIVAYPGQVFLSSFSEEAAHIPHFSDPCWDRLWAACQANAISIHWHVNGQLPLPIPRWPGYTLGQTRVLVPSPICTLMAQFMPHLLFSGVLERFPRLQWVLTETGMGFIQYIVEACDREWERMRLWSEGLLTRPSELLRRQLYGTIWYEQNGVKSREVLGTDRIMFQVDYPHNTSIYPRTYQAIETVLAGLPQADLEAILWRNAARLYGLEITA